MSQFFLTFGQPILVCLTMLGILGYLGLHVLKREVIFIDISLAQISAVGAIMAHIVFHVHDDSLQSYISAFILVLITALFYSFARRKIHQISLETVIGVSYVIAAAAALFIVGVAPGGHVHIQNMLSGSLLWTTWKDILLCFIIFSGVGICFYIFRDPFKRISENYNDAYKKGMKVVLWDFLFYALLGIVITVSVRIGGIVVIFAFLIIPATISALFSNSLKKRLGSALGVGIGAVIMGFLFAQQLDFSVGPSVSLFLGLELIFAGVFSLLSKRT